MKKIILKNSAELQLPEIGADGVQFHFLPDGTLNHAEFDEIMINLFNGNIIEGGLGNIYLRVFTSQGIEFTPLTGPSAPASYQIGEDRIVATGNFSGIEFRSSFICAENNFWFRSTTLCNISDEPVSCDLVCFQDIGIAATAAVRNNEAYVSQYIDHAVFIDREFGDILCARQNLPQDGRHPHLISGCLNCCDGFLTDGFQFYGLSCKADGKPAALQQETFANTIRQYEFSAHTMKSKRVQLTPRQDTEICFFFSFNPDHSAVSSQHDTLKAAEAASIYSTIKDEIKSLLPLQKKSNLFTESELFCSMDFALHELADYFGTEYSNEEWDDTGLQSFFTPLGKHVVLKSKELLTERPHGHILRSGASIYPDSEVGSCAVWMNGVFNSHQSFGNIGFQMCTSVVRGALNLQRTGGVRVFVGKNGKWQLLGLPSAFEIGLDCCRWFYKNSKRTIIVTTESLPASGDFSIKLESSDCDTEFMIVTSVVFGGSEYQHQIPVELDATTGIYTVRPAPESPVAENHPDSQFRIIPQSPVKLDSTAFDNGLFTDNQCRNYPFLTTKTKPVSSFTLIFAAHSRPEYFPEDYRVDSATTDNAYYWKKLCNNSSINASKGNGMDRLSEIMPWFVHNAMIHLATPYGLEQFNGAAWGTRDICQGPVEMLLAFGQHTVVRDIIFEIYRHQYDFNGGWPQWFMFDNYRHIQHAESHGDIIAWPIKAVCDYIENSNDLSIFDEQIAYTDRDFNFTTVKKSLFEHIIYQLEHIDACFVPGTKLISYGDGDWNDSLQPADKNMKKQLVSSWTVQLLYQQLNRLATAFRHYGAIDRADSLTELCTKIKADFNTYLVKAGITAGFAYFKDPKNPELLLHPEDSHTNIKYRLLPVNRGIISEIFTPEQAIAHEAMAQEYLLLPDGANLMYPPPVYRGGKSHYFQRAETASFFGREIGNHYVHAHLRYAEAMAKRGNKDEFFKALLTVNPVKLKDSVEMVNSCQSNCYFSSFDAAFNNRYEVVKGYAELAKGNIKINTGWRIYSSGPGIFVSLIVTRLFGLRLYYDKFIIDPMIPNKIGTVDYLTTLMGCQVTFRFISDTVDVTVTVNGQAVEPVDAEYNPFRNGGLIFNINHFKTLLNPEQTNLIEVTY
jgi:1,2-beta-oligoglucan phosphorylase